MATNNQRVRKYAILLTAIGLSFSYFVASVVFNQNTLDVPEQFREGVIWPAPQITREAEFSALEFRQLWVLNNVYFHSITYGPAIAAFDNQVFILGSFNQNKAGSLNEIDAASGSVGWSGANYNTVVALYASELGIFVGHLHGVDAYEPTSGQLLWSFPLPRGGEAHHIYGVEKTIHVRTVQRLYVLSEQTGEILKTDKFTPGFGPVLQTDEIHYFQPTGNSLRAIDPNSGLILWTTNIADGYLRGPIIAGDTLFVRSGGEAGRVFAIDKKRGQLLWQSKDNIVSNVVLGGSAIYMLHQDGELLKLNSETGLVQASLEFGPEPLRLLESLQEKQFYLAIDNQNNTLFVLLGDSAQLFAFSIE